MLSRLLYSWLAVSVAGVCLVCVCRVVVLAMGVVGSVLPFLACLVTGVKVKVRVGGGRYSFPPPHPCCLFVHLFGLVLATQACT